MSWSVPFSTWMPWASYFVGGIAFHAYGSVPSYPASHGCIRMMAARRAAALSRSRPTARPSTWSGTARESVTRLHRVRAALALALAASACRRRTRRRRRSSRGRSSSRSASASSALQAGVVRGRDVILARGFEVELARMLARRLGAPGRTLRRRAGRRERLLAAGRAGVAPRARSDRAVARRPRARQISATRTSRPTSPSSCAAASSGRAGWPTCARGSSARSAGRARSRPSLRSIRPTRAPLVAVGTERLRALVRTGACDAAVLPAARSGTLRGGPTRACSARSRAAIEHGEGLVVAVPRGLGDRCRSRRPRAAAAPRGRHARTPCARVARARPGHAPPASLNVVR